MQSTLVFFAAFVASISANHMAFMPFATSPLAKIVSPSGAASLSAIDAASPADKAFFSAVPASSIFAAAPASSAAALGAVDALSPANKAIFSAIPASASFGAAPASSAAALSAVDALSPASRAIFAAIPASASFGAAPASSAAALSAVDALSPASRAIFAAIPASASFGAAPASSAAALSAIDALSPASRAIFAAIPASTYFGAAPATSAAALGAFGASSPLIRASFIASSPASASPAATFIAVPADAGTLLGSASAPLSRVACAGGVCMLVDAADAASGMSRACAGGACITPAHAAFSPSGAALAPFLTVAKASPFSSLYSPVSAAHSLSPAVAAKLMEESAFDVTRALGASPVVAVHSPAAALLSPAHHFAASRLMAGASPFVSAAPAHSANDASSDAITAAILEDSMARAGPFAASPAFAPVASAHGAVPAGHYVASPAGPF